MITSSLHQNNRLIRKTIMRVYPSSFAANLTTSIAPMVDTLLAGALLGKEAIAAVAIGLPVLGIFQALAQMVVNGMGVKLAVAAGRGDQKEMNRIYSSGLAGTVVLGSFFIVICLLMAELLTNLFGGAGNPAVGAQAALYLRALCVSVLMASVNMFFARVLALYGYQKAVFLAAVIAIAGNVVFSILYITLLPVGMKIAGLGLGTWNGGILAVISAYTIKKKKKIPMCFRFRDFDGKELVRIFRAGVPSSGNSLADAVAAGVVNNIIVAGFGGDTTALSVYTAVKAVDTFGKAAAQSAAGSSAPLYGILYGSRDKNGILRTVRESVKIGIVAVVVWCSLLFTMVPALGSFYGMGDTPQFRSGVIICMLLMPLSVILRVFTQLFESTEKVGMGILYSVVPDSVVYPVLLVFLLPLMGYSGLWLSFAGNALPFGVGLYLVRSLKNKTLRVSMERLLCLDETIRDHVPALDISIRSNHTDVTGISDQVHRFLTEQKASSRTAYMTALCLEELAADFVAHTMKENSKSADRTIMDIKLFSDEDSLRIIIRNEASSYNPLDFALDDATFAKVGVKLAQKVARKIEYSYVYQLNIITIVLDK